VLNLQEVFTVNSWLINKKSELVCAVNEQTRTIKVSLFSVLKPTKKITYRHMRMTQCYILCEVIKLECLTSNWYKRNHNFFPFLVSEHLYAQRDCSTVYKFGILRFTIAFVQIRYNLETYKNVLGIKCVLHSDPHNSCPNILLLKRKKKISNIRWNYAHTRTPVSTCPLLFAHFKKWFIETLKWDKPISVEE